MNKNPTAAKPFYRKPNIKHIPQFWLYLPGLCICLTSHQKALNSTLHLWVSTQLWLVYLSKKLALYPSCNMGSGCGPGDSPSGTGHPRLNTGVQCYHRCMFMFTALVTRHHKKITYNVFTCHRFYLSVPARWETWESCSNRVSNVSCFIVNYLMFYRLLGDFWRSK